MSGKCYVICKSFAGSDMFSGEHSMHVDKSIVFRTSQTMSLGVMTLGKSRGLPAVYKAGRFDETCFVGSLSYVDKNHFCRGLVRTAD